jgi:hypothetical protein
VTTCARRTSPAATSTNRPARTVIGVCWSERAMRPEGYPGRRSRRIDRSRPSVNALMRARARYGRGADGTRGHATPQGLQSMIVALLPPLPAPARRHAAERPVRVPGAHRELGEPDRAPDRRGVAHGALLDVRESARRFRRRSRRLAAVRRGTRDRIGRLTDDGPASAYALAGASGDREGSSARTVRRRSDHGARSSRSIAATNSSRSKGRPWPARTVSTGSSRIRSSDRRNTSRSSQLSLSST